MKTELDEMEKVRLLARELVIHAYMSLSDSPKSLHVPLATRTA
jgi:hypothetical protein